MDSDLRLVGVARADARSYDVIDDDAERLVADEEGSTGELPSLRRTGAATCSARRDVP